MGSRSSWWLPGLPRRSGRRCPRPGALVLASVRRSASKPSMVPLGVGGAVSSVAAGAQPTRGCDSRTGAARQRAARVVRAEQMDAWSSVVDDDQLGAWAAVGLGAMPTGPGGPAWPARRSPVGPMRRDTVMRSVLVVIVPLHVVAGLFGLVECRHVGTGRRAGWRDAARCNLPLLRQALGDRPLEQVTGRGQMVRSDSGSCYMSASVLSTLGIEAVVGRGAASSAGAGLVEIGHLLTSGAIE